MPAASELAGTIGTWIAVFLAIVAFAGVLPAYVLFRRSRTTRGQAVASVDHHNQDFVSHSFSLMGTRINQRVKVPDLRDPPSKEVFEGCQNIDMTKLRSCDSTTCWVNFAHLMRTIFPTIGSSTDYGLPLDTVLEEHTRRQDVDYHIAGRCGLILRRKNDENRTSVKLYFETHPLDVVRTALAHDLIPLRTLVLRYLGYIQLAPNTYIKPSELRYGDQYPSERRNKFTEKAMIARLISGHVLAGDRSILRDIGLDLNKTAFVYLRVTPVTFTTEFGFRANSGKLLPQDLEKGGHFEVGDWKLNRYETRANVWMERREVQKIVMPYLTAEMSVNSLLYHNSRDMIARRLLKHADLASTLDLAKGIIDSLQLTDRTKIGLRRTITAVSEPDAKISAWNKHAIQTLYALDQYLEVIGRSRGFMWRTISILYAYDTDFRSILRRIAQKHSSVIRFQIEDKSLSFQASRSLSGVAFDFHHVFDKTELAPKLVNGDMPMNEAILPALKGHIRAAMWKLCLSPAGLLGIFSDTTDAICLLGASPAGNLARPQERSCCPDMWSQISLPSNKTRDDNSGRSLLLDGQFRRVRRWNHIAHENPMNSGESLHGGKIDDYDGLLHITAFGDQLAVLRDDNGLASANLPRHVDQGVESGASIHHASVNLETDPVPISIAESPGAAPDSVSASSIDQEWDAMPDQPVNTLGSPHHQEVTSGTATTGEEQLDTSQGTGDHELCVGEILNADRVPHVLRLLECTSGAIRLEGRPLNSTTESLPSWTVFLTTTLFVARDVDLFHLEGRSVVSMARPDSGIFYFGSEHRLSKNFNDCYVLPVRRREDAANLISQWQKFCEEGEIRQVDRAVLAIPST